MESIFISQSKQKTVFFLAFNINLSLFAVRLRPKL